MSQSCWNIYPLPKLQRSGVFLKDVCRNYVRKTAFPAWRSLAICGSSQRMQKSLLINGKQTVEKLSQPKASEGKIIGKTAPQGDSERNRPKGGT